MRTRLQVIYNCMKQRCYNPHRTQYKNYGGRGIIVCEEWKNSFKNFKDWAMKNGYKDNLTIDRINTNGNYEPSNCRWATVKEQQRNKRTNTHLTCNGKTLLIQEWSELTGLSTSRICLRLKAGWSVEKALLTPIDVSKVRHRK